MIMQMEKQNVELEKIPFPAFIQQEDFSPAGFHIATFQREFPQTEDMKMREEELLEEVD